MQDLELEHAELLPSRETLWSSGGPASELQRHQRGAATATDEATFGLVNVSAVNGDGNLNGILRPVAPARLAPLACALPEGDARPAREGRPAPTRGGPPACGPPGPGRSAGPFLMFWCMQGRSRP